MIVVVAAMAYVIGSIPFGNIVVKVFSGGKLGGVAAGHMSGTKAMRVAGITAALLTTVLDALKGAACVWLARWILPSSTEATGMVVAGLGGMVGHIYPLFLR